MEFDKNEKPPELLDFSVHEDNDIINAVYKLESILYNSIWKKHLEIDETLNEDKLLFLLLHEKAVILKKVYYISVDNFTNKVKSRANEYFHRLLKRKMDDIYFNSVNCFSQYEPDIKETFNGAIFYPEIKTYVRCGDLSPGYLFELLQKDDCERVAIFAYSSDNIEPPWDVFYLFEIRAAKAYILEKLDKMKKQKMREMEKIINELNLVIPYNEENDDIID